eukprot:SAG31_NODE_55_length_29938_cov_9.154027_11_plen_505_part_00
MVLRAPSARELAQTGESPAEWARRNDQLRPQPGAYHAAIHDPDVIACVQRSAATGLERAYATQALVYWPESTPAMPAANRPSIYAFGVVLVPGTSGGNGPGRRQEPGLGGDGGSEAAGFTPHAVGVYQTAARDFLRPAGIPVIQLAWSDFRQKGEASGPAEKAYKYDGAKAANPPATAAGDFATVNSSEPAEINEMNCVAAAKVEAAVKVLLAHGCNAVVLAGHSMGSAVTLEVARRHLQAELLVAGSGRPNDPAPSEIAYGLGWRKAANLHALCLLSGAGTHWTIGPGWSRTPAGVDAARQRRRPFHRALTNEPGQPRSLLEKHGVPLLVMNAEHEIGCAKGIYWEEFEKVDEATSSLSSQSRLKTRGMFATTRKTYAVLLGRNHSWRLHHDASTPSLSSRGNGNDYILALRNSNELVAQWLARWIQAPKNNASGCKIDSTAEENRRHHSSEALQTTEYINVWDPTGAASGANEHLGTKAPMQFKEKQDDRGKTQNNGGGARL